METVGHPWLEIECSRYKTRRNIDLAALRPSTTADDLDGGKFLSNNFDWR
ncbi:MAG TPA: hypothetical protein PK706_14145 [Xanthobacteraceae bacterium]|jgi:hypothetical protein|nr:hypothetical protein [Xanthobacteraceae bacterium]